MTLDSVYMLSAFAGKVVLAVWAFYLLYILAMGIYRAYLAKRLSLFQKIILSPVIAVMLFVDWFMNWTLCILLFLEVPEEYLVTQRLQRYIKEGDGDWRHLWALAICDNLLDIFDPTGNHC